MTMSKQILFSFSLLLTMLGISYLQAEEALHTPASNDDKKIITLRMYLPSSKDLVIRIVDGTILPANEEYSIDLSPQYPSETNIEITKPHNNKVIFFISPQSLYHYLKIPKISRANYNYNIESRTTGEERLLQALSTSVEYNFDTLPSTIFLPDPLRMLNELLG